MSKPEGRRSFLYDNMLRIMRNHGVIKLHSYRTLNGAGFISELCDFIEVQVSQREHIPGCSIYRRPTLSGCRYCCDCSMRRFHLRPEGGRAVNDRIRDRLRALKRPSNTDAACPIHATEDDLAQLIQTYGAEQRLDEIKRILAHTGDLELELDGAYMQNRIVLLELEATLGKSVAENNQIEE